MKTYVKIDNKSEGLHPSQAAVIFSTKDGPKEIILDRSFLMDGLFTAFLVGRDGKDFLIELPAETSDGRWRVTVDESAIEQEKLAA